MMSPLQTLESNPLKVSIIGSGNWGSVIGKIVALNAKAFNLFDDNVRIWVYEETINNKKLTEIINETHENIKYLPGIKLPDNLSAVPSLQDTVQNADLLVFVLPHQFLKRTCEILKPFILSHNVKAISLIKGLYVDETCTPKLSSQLINEILGIECCVLSGANVAKDVAKEEFSEATLGYENRDSAILWQKLFDTPYFKINGVPDIAGVEICGAVKNIIALAAGFCDGLDLGSNTKAAIIRQGFEELRLFSVLLFGGILEDTFFDSSGIADVITTCFGGRNVKCAAEFVRAGGTKSWDTIEKEFLNGQKLQGTLTCQDVIKIIRDQNLEAFFPLFEVTHKISFENLSASMLIKTFKVNTPRRLKTLDDCTNSILPGVLKHSKLIKGGKL